jgi:DNA-binding NarL/FixJ family response regulator
MHASAAEKGINAGAAMYVSKASTADHLSACIESLVKVKRV